MKPEKLLKLEPLSGIPPTFCLKEFKYDGNLLLGVQDQNHESAPILTIYFEDPYTLRVTGKHAKPIDSYDLDQALINMEQDQDYDFKWSLFKVENSRYLEWFHEQCVGLKRNVDIAHYLIKTPNETIEVLDVNNSSPTLMWY